MMLTNNGALLIDSSAVDQNDVQYQGGIAVRGSTGAVYVDGTLDPVWDRPQLQPMTAAGSYTGNGTTQNIALPFRPDFVVVKSSAAQFAVFQNNVNFARRTDHFLNQSSLSGEFGITITDNGFTVGNDNKVNQSATTIYYFAYCDNGTNSVLQGNWQGNLTAGRTVDMFRGTPLQGLFIKRDSASAAVYVIADAPQNYFFDGAANAVSVGTTLNGNTGVLTVGSGAEVNQWAGILGEGTNCLAFPRDSESVFMFTYVGTGAARTINLPFEPEFFIIVPRSTAVATSRSWFSSLPAGNSAPLTNGAVGSGEFTVTRNAVVFAGTANNNTGVEYAMIAFKKLKSVANVPVTTAPVTIRKSVQLSSGGYIDCSTDSSLAISGSLTMEWYGAVYNVDQAQYTASPTIDTDAGNQDKLQPLLFRSNGNDTTANAVNFGMAIAAPQVSTDVYPAQSVLLINTYDSWGLLQSTGGNLDNHPFNVAICFDSGNLNHILATYDEPTFTWRVYVNGVQVKERKRNLQAAIGRAAVTGFAGAQMVIGARKRTIIDNANGMNFKLARLYNRALTPSEAFQNYLSVLGRRVVVPGFVEEWKADNASGSTILATKNTANNGTIVNGVVY